MVARTMASLVRNWWYTAALVTPEGVGDHLQRTCPPTPWMPKSSRATSTVRRCAGL